MCQLDIAFVTQVQGSIIIRLACITVCEVVSHYAADACLMVGCGALAVPHSGSQRCHAILLAEQSEQDPRLLPVLTECLCDCLLKSHRRGTRYAHKHASERPVLVVKASSHERHRMLPCCFSKTAICNLSLHTSVTQCDTQCDEHLRFHLAAVVATQLQCVFSIGTCVA